MDWTIVFWAIVAILAVLFSGFAGVVVTILYERHRAKVPTLTYRIQFDRILSDEFSQHALKARVVVEHEEHAYEVKKLSLVTVEIENDTGSDYPRFEFSVTLPGESTFIQADLISKDDYHRFEAVQNPSVVEPASKLDLKCEPLNRGDKYTAKLYVQTRYGVLAVSDIGVATAAPLKLKRHQSPKSEMSITAQADLIAKLSGVVMGLGIVLALLATVGSLMSYFTSDKNQQTSQEAELNENVERLLEAFEKSRENEKQHSQESPQTPNDQP